MLQLPIHNIYKFLCYLIMTTPQMLAYHIHKLLHYLIVIFPSTSAFTTSTSAHILIWTTWIPLSRCTHNFLILLLNIVGHKIYMQPQKQAIYQ